MGESKGVGEFACVRERVRELWYPCSAPGGWGRGVRAPRALGDTRWLEWGWRAVGPPFLPLCPGKPTPVNTFYVPFASSPPSPPLRAHLPLVP